MAATSVSRHLGLESGSCEEKNIGDPFLCIFVSDVNIVNAFFAFSDTHGHRIVLQTYLSAREEVAIITPSNEKDLFLAFL